MLGVIVDILTITVDIILADGKRIEGIRRI